jgi:dihydroneopterin aldolase
MVGNKSADCDYQIVIDQLEAWGIIGINDWEKQTKQKIMISLSMSIDQKAALQSDQIDDTVNYKAVVDSIQSWINSQSFNLLERLGQSIIDQLVATYQPTTLCISLTKSASIAYVKSYGVKLTYRQSSDG